jgi:GTPase SAR1 family protein
MENKKVSYKNRDEEKGEEEVTNKYRIFMAGNVGVGKTCLINRYINNSFRKEYYPTKDLV